MEDFARFISATPSEAMMRDELVGRITDVVTSLWPTAEVKLFGSFAAGICLPTSDIDIVVLGKWESLPLRTLAKALQVVTFTFSLGCLHLPWLRPRPE